MFSESNESLSEGTASRSCPGRLAILPPDTRIVQEGRVLKEPCSDGMEQRDLLAQSSLEA